MESDIPTYVQEEIDWSVDQVLESAGIYIPNSEQFQKNIEDIMRISLMAVYVKTQSGAAAEALAEQSRQHSMIWKALVDRYQHGEI